MIWFSVLHYTQLYQTSKGTLVKKVESWQEVSLMHFCHPKQQISKHCPDKLAVKPSGMKIQHHDDKCTCLAILYWTVL